MILIAESERAVIKSQGHLGNAGLILDVRDRADYSGKGGHIPGAKNVPLPEVQSRIGELEAWRQRPLAVVCQTNKMSGKAADLLRGEGFRQVLLVDDGMVGWSGNGFKTE